MRNIGVLDTLTGTLVHDGYGEYLTFDNVTHAACGAHILRNLASVAEVASQADWADAMIDLLWDLHDLAVVAWDDHPVDVAGPPHLDPDVPADCDRRHEEIIDTAYQANPEPQGRKRDSLERESYKLACRLDRRRDEVLRFAHDLDVGFTNNAAERPLRPIKLHDRISGTFRSITHAKAWLALRSNPWLPATP